MYLSKVRKYFRCYILTHYVFQGMFDLSKFMIGTGSDAESASVKDNISDISENIKRKVEEDEPMLPKLDPIDIQETCDNSDAKNSDIQICDDAMIPEKDDIESPEWSDNDLQSWQSDIKITNTTSKKRHVFCCFFQAS